MLALPVGQVVADISNTAHTQVEQAGQETLRQLPQVKETMAVLDQYPEVIILAVEAELELRLRLILAEMGWLPLFLASPLITLVAVADLILRAD